MKAITSAENACFRRWVRLAGSTRVVRTQRCTLAEGDHLAAAVSAAGHPVDAVIVRKGERRPEVRRWIDTFAASGVTAYELPAALFDRLSSVEHGAGLLLVIPVPAPATPEDADALYLDRVQDPGNAGALLRVAAAAGVRNVFTAPGTVSLWSPKVLRGAQGAHFGLRLIEDIEADHLREVLPAHWIGAVAHSRTSLWAADLDARTVGWVVGAEGSGLSAPAAAACDEFVTIPLAAGVESLNVAAAAAVCLFERRRRSQQDVGRTRRGLARTAAAGEKSAIGEAGEGGDHVA